MTSSINTSLNRDAVALIQLAAATGDTAHNLAAEQTIAGRERETFLAMYHSRSRSDAPGHLDGATRYHIRGAGAPMQSGVNTHLALGGEASFFPVYGQNDNTNLQMTRIGSFSRNNNNEYENHFGMRLGYIPVASDGSFPATVSATDFQVLNAQALSSASQPTTTIECRAGLNGNIGDVVTKGHNVYDSSGTPRTLIHNFERVSTAVANTQLWRVSVHPPTGSTVTNYLSPTAPLTDALFIEFASNGKPTRYLLGDPAGAHTVLADSSNNTKPVIDLTWPVGSGAGNSTFSLDYGDPESTTGLITIASGQSRLQVKSDGYPAGEFVDLDVAKDGTLTARFDNGPARVIGKIAVGMVNNPDGMNLSENGVLSPFAPKSGDLFFRYLGSGNVGEVSSGALEGATVEVIREMSKMITREQQFNNIATSANTKVRMWNAINTINRG